MTFKEYTPKGGWIADRKRKQRLENVKAAACGLLFALVLFSLYTFTYYAETL